MSYELPGYDAMLAREADVFMESCCGDGLPEWAMDKAREQIAKDTDLLSDTLVELLTETELVTVILAESKTANDAVWTRLERKIETLAKELVQERIEQDEIDAAESCDD